MGNTMRKDETYNGWKVLSVADVPDHKSTGVHLRHEKSGMEVFHLVNDDSENLFAFGFKTLSPNGTGVAHIMEHSVLCGSRNYNMKDPFTVLGQQSIKTFLNAMTFPDKTVYPASSVVEEDYFNLMSVYGDAVFFPNLDERMFRQEGHRFELDGDGKLSIQGVVYNEMKGNYSSFDSVVFDRALQTLFPGTQYAKDSGGNPDEIPDLTYEAYRAFHKKFYAPSNCRLFLYGNIPTEKQLDFVNDRFLGGFESFEPPLDPADARVDFVPFAAPVERSLTGPLTNGEDARDNGSTVLLGWVLGESASAENCMQAELLDELLLGNDGSPMTRALLESGLGEDIAPASGFSPELQNIMAVLGLRGVRAEDAPKVRDCVLAVLRGIAENGFTQKELESALMAVELDDREVKRDWGPYAITLMEQCYLGWMNGASPADTLLHRAAFAKIKADIASDPKYMQRLVAKLFLENPHRALVTVTPDASFAEDMQAACQKRLLAVPQSDYPRIKAEQAALYEYQAMPDSPEAQKAIPFIHPSTLSAKLERVDTVLSTLGAGTSDQKAVPLYEHDQPVNGVSYLTVAIPVDVLKVEDYPLLPFFARCLPNMSINGMGWAESAAHVAGIAGGFGASLFASSAAPVSAGAGAGLSKSCGAGAACGAGAGDSEVSGQDTVREWLFVTVKMLEEKTADAVNLVFDTLETAAFSDGKRLADLLNEYRNDFVSAVVPQGHVFAGRKASATMTRAKAVYEVWNGLSQLFFITELSKQEPADIAQKLSAIKDALLASRTGMLVNVTAGTEGLLLAKEALAARAAKYRAPLAKTPEETPAAFAATADFARMVTAAGEKTVLYDAHSQVGFASVAVPCAGLGDKDLGVYKVLCHWLSNGLLWEKIRTKGGAYGAFARTDELERTVVFSTYRDPNPVQSFKAVEEALSEAAVYEFAPDELEKAITGTYSGEIQPVTPTAKGFSAFTRILFGVTQELREARVASELAVTADDMRRVAGTLLKAVKDAPKVVISSKDSGWDGKIVALPL